MINRKVKEQDDVLAKAVIAMRAVRLADAGSAAQSTRSTDYALAVIDGDMKLLGARWISLDAVHVLYTLSRMEYHGRRITCLQLWRFIIFNISLSFLQRTSSSRSHEFV